MTSWIVSVLIGFSESLLVASIGIRYWRRYTRGEKAFVGLMAYDTVGIVIGAFLAYYYHNNIIMSHIFSIVSVGLLSIYFQKYLTDKTAKKILYWFPFVYAVLNVSMIVGVTGVFNDSPFGYAIRGLFVIVFGTIALSEVVTAHDNYFRNGNFWIIVGLLFFYTLNMGYLTMSYWLIKTDSELTMIFHAVLQYSYHIAIILYAVGLWLLAKERAVPLKTSEETF